jgi:hypothetical protein
LVLGSHTLTSDDNFVVGGGTAATATNLGAAINALPGFSATVLGSDVTISGPPGPDGNDIVFEAISGGDITNFTLSPTDGSLQSAEPIIGPPQIT